MDGNQHAPTPWNIVNLDTDGVCISTNTVRRGSYCGMAITSNGKTLALIPHADCQFDANARLIAVAPMLLGLVREMIGDKRLDVGDWIGRATALVEDAGPLTVKWIVALDDKAS